MSDKPKFLLATAEAVANKIIHSITGIGDAVERIQIAGSIRRRKPQVGDIEILYIPTYRTLPPADFFSTKPLLQNCVDEIISTLILSGHLEKRLNKDGHETWGEKNKLARAVKTGIPVDFFATTEECWFNYLVCRTGSAQSNIRIAAAAQAIGWKWNPYGPGFSRGSERHQIASEEEVFHFVGLDYLPPEARI